MKTVEIKAFVPARDFELSKQFYQDLGFEMASDEGGISYFKSGESSFLLEDSHEETHASNLTMHLLVEDLHAYHASLKSTDIEEKYGIEIPDIITQPWGMLEFTIVDPTGIRWRVAQNI